MPLNPTYKSARFLQGKRYTHDSFSDSQEAFTSVLDLSTSDIYSETNLIPSASLPFSGSGQSGATSGVLKYWYRQRLTPSNLNREVWFFLIPSGSSVGAQLLDSGQQTNFISPKYSIPSISQNTTEDSTPGYAVKVFVSTGSATTGYPRDTEVLQSTKYAFDYKNGVLEISSSADTPTASQFVYATVYQYIGNTLNNRLVVSQITASSFSGSIASASYAATASYALNGGGTTGPATQSLFATSSIYATSASWASSSVSASYSNTASWALNLVGGTGNATNATFATQSMYATQSLFATQSVYSTSSIYTVSASWVSASVRITTADTASYYNQLWIVSGSTYPITSSWATNATTAVTANAISFVPLTATSASWVSASVRITTADTASYYNQLWLVSGSTYPITSSWATTATTANAISFAINASTFSTQSTYSTQSIYATSASWVSASVRITTADTASYYNQLWLVSGSSYPITSSWSTTATTANAISFVPTTATSASWVSASVRITTAETASYYNQLWLVSGSTYPITSSWAVTAVSASFITFVTQTATSASWVSASAKITTADTASYVTASNIAGTVVSASYAITCSYIRMPIKAGIVTGSSFGGNPRTASVVFARPFADNNYTITVTGDSARTWLIQNRVSGSFRISSNAATPITGSTYWQAIYQGEYN